MARHRTTNGSTRPVTLAEGRQIIDREARRHFGISGEEFRRRYHAGELPADDTRVVSVALLFPIAERG